MLIPAHQKQYRLRLMLWLGVLGVLGYGIRTFGSLLPWLILQKINPAYKRKRG